MIEKGQIGELRMALNALYRRIAELEQRIRALENPQPKPQMVGSIEGIDWELTATPVPRFDP